MKSRDGRSFSNYLVISEFECKRAEGNRSFFPISVTVRLDTRNERESRTDKEGRNHRERKREREREKERVWRMERKRERNGKREKEARGRFGAPGTHNYTLAHGEPAKRSRRREAKLNTFQSAPSSWSADTARTRHEEFRSLIYSCSDPDWSSIGSTAPF